MGFCDRLARVVDGLCDTYCEYGGIVGIGSDFQSTAADAEKLYVLFCFHSRIWIYHTIDSDGVRDCPYAAFVYDMQRCLSVILCMAFVL